MESKRRSIIDFCFYASLVIGCMAILCTGPALAKVAGPCSDCHTMHNSQDGAVWPDNDDGPFRALTTGGCVGCHTGSNDGTIDNNIPYVMDTSAPTYGPDYAENGTYSNAGNTLAGGNFYWVATAGGGTDNAGHNVSTDSLSTADGAIGQTPPGFVGDWGTAGIGATWANNQLTCAGTYGCHGSHTYADDFTDISGAHHADDTGGIDGTTVGLSYRFLYKIIGNEMNTVGHAWEYQPTAEAHNQYRGYDRTDASVIPALGSTSGGDTISFSCGECHGDYHSGADVAYSDPIEADPWLRHPSDYDMGNTSMGSEYADYYGATGTTNVYNVVAPVASFTVSSVLSTVFPEDDNDTAIVTCLSCHRAHGSPYADLLRWDYAQMKAGSQTPAGWNNKGCFACHTTKDNG